MTARAVRQRGTWEHSPVKKTIGRSLPFQLGSVVEHMACGQASAQVNLSTSGELYEPLAGLGVVTWTSP